MSVKSRTAVAVYRAMLPALEGENRCALFSWLVRNLSE